MFIANSDNMGNSVWKDIFIFYTLHIFDEKIQHWNGSADGLAFASDTHHDQVPKILARRTFHTR